MMKTILAMVSIAAGENIVSNHHDITATVHMVDGIYCSTPSFPLAKNIDCNGPLKTGTYCDHKCGDVTVRSTCNTVLYEVFGVKINTGTVELIFDNECIIKVVEQKTSISGIKTIAKSEGECIDYINEEVAPKIREKLLSKCDGDCEIDFDAECEEPKRRRRSNHIEFNVNMDLTVTGANGVQEITSDDIAEATGDVDVFADTIEVASEPATEKIETIAPELIVAEVGDGVEDGSDDEPEDTNTADGELTVELVEELFHDLSHELEEKMETLENENLDLLVKIKLMDDNAVALENTIKTFESKIKKNRFYSFMQNSQTQTDMMNMKNTIDQLITDVYHGIFSKSKKSA